MPPLRPLRFVSLVTAALTACTQPRTEIVTVVTSEVPWGAGRELQSLSVEVRTGSSTGPQRSLRVFPLGTTDARTALPLRFGILPDASRAADDATPVWVEVLGCAGTECDGGRAVVSQRAIVQFAYGKTLELRLTLASACAGNRCTATQACNVTTGECVDARTSPGELGSSTDDAGSSMTDARANDTGRTDDASTTLDVQRAPDAGDVPGVMDAPSVIDVPRATDVPTAVDVPTVTDVPTVMDVPAVTDVPTAVDVAQSPDRPDVVDAPVVVDVPAPCPTGMAYIPAGDFLMGDPTPDAYRSQPIHGVHLSAYCIDRTEVTVADYARCAAVVCQPPFGSTNCNGYITGRDQHPINCVDWSRARAYCRWRGGDLPTEAQWEHAARGPDNRTYPWGSAGPAGQLCWNRDSSTGSTCPVRSHPSGDSAFGVSDMAGNVREWVSDWQANYLGSASTTIEDPTGPETGIFRGLRGGAWMFQAAQAAGLRSAYRDESVPGNGTSSSIGFRCAHAPL